MTDIEKRAHEIALVTLHAKAAAHSKYVNTLPAPVKKMTPDVDVYQIYKEVYDSCFKSLSEDEVG